MHRSRLLITICTTVALATAGAVVPVQAGAAPKGLPTGIVYTTTNACSPSDSSCRTPSARGNEVVAYRQAADGTLTRIGSWPTGGLGTGAREAGLLGPPDVDQSIIVDRQRRLLFTVNERSDSIAVFTINGDGSLTPVKGSPFPSGGDNPASLGLVGNQLYVVNKADDPGLFGGITGADVSDRRPNYTGFRVAGNGHLTPIPHSSVGAAAGSSPTQALVSPNGRFLFGSDFFGTPARGDGSQLRSLVIAANGRLSDAPGSPLGSNRPEVSLPTSAPDPVGFLARELGNVVVGLQVHPTQPYVYAGQPLNSLDDKQEHLAVYRYDSSGRLSYVRSVPASGIALCWLVFNADASRMYTTNTLDGSVSVFDMSNPAHPIELSKLTLSGHSGAPFGGTAPGQLAQSSDGRFLHVTSGGVSTGDSADHRLVTLKIVGDTLTEVADADVSLPGGVRFEPLGIVVL